jgi:hypothetical protein
MFTVAQFVTLSEVEGQRALEGMDLNYQVASNEEHRRREVRYDFKQKV